jgi:uncharacterized delta-60 repeat protein
MNALSRNAIICLVVGSAACLGGANGPFAGAVEEVPANTPSHHGWTEGRDHTEAVTLGWVRRYNGPGNGDDQALALALDSQGNVLVTGYSMGDGTDWDYATIKYSPTGQVLWVRRYNGPGSGVDGANAIGVDALGNVYVTGHSLGTASEDDFATIKYSPEGEELWVRRYNGPANGADGATALGLDAQGSVYVTGLCPDPLTGYDFCSVKYSAVSQQLWARQYNGPGRRADDPASLAVDSQGNVIVTGYSTGYVTGVDYATVKYAPDGTLVWARHYNGPAYGGDYPTAVALDAQDNVYVTGYSWGVPGAASSCEWPSDYATIKYSPTGTPRWLDRYDGPYQCADVASAIAVDRQGNVFVTGYSTGGTPPVGTGPDYATIKYSPDGQQVWIRRYNGPSNDADLPSAIATDEAGNSYVTGRSYGGDSSYDILTISYSPSGQWRWGHRYKGPGNGLDRAFAIKVDGQGNVFVSGSSPGIGSGDDFITIQYGQP